MEGVNKAICERKEQIQADNSILDAIRNIDVSTLTPIEAMNELYRIQKEVMKLYEN